MVAVKARREGNHLTSAKLCKVSGDGEEMVQGRHGVKRLGKGKVKECCEQQMDEGTEGEY